MPLSCSAPSVGVIFKIAESYDIDPEPLMKQLEISPTLMKDPNARFPFDKVDKLWVKITEKIQDPLLGLRAAKYWHPSQMGSLGYAWLASSSLRTALNRLAHYSKIVTDNASIKVEETDEILSVHLLYNSPSPERFCRTDAVMAILLTMCRANCGEEFHPISISLIHDEPEDSGEFYALFECPIHFGAAENCFNISVEAADKHLLTSNPRLTQINDQIMIETLAKLDQNNIVERVKAEIIKQLSSGKITDSNLAEALFMTKRTLQRRLKKEDTSVKKILTEIRTEMAKKYVQDSSISLIEVSFLLGFIEFSSFSRAFKRWTGITPSEYKSLATHH